jgi:hypothetical protein
MQKKGQMYIVAALIIASLIIGLSSIYNYARSTKEDTSIFDLSKEIDYETSRVIDSGVFNQENFSINVDSISKYYADLNPHSELITLTGNLESSEIIAHHYKLDQTGTVCIQTGACSGLNFFTKIKQTPIQIPSGNQVQVVLDQGETYDFELKTGENFYIVLIKEDENEKIVAST